MTHTPSLPELFSAYRLDDSLMAEAYEALGPEKRAVLKKNIAVLYAVWREQRESTCLTRHLPEGYTVHQETHPAPYTLVVCAAAFPSPACFLAAAMPALLAGVGLVVPCFVGAAARPHAALVAATELAGLEDAVALPDEEQVLPLLHALHGQGARGRLVVLGHAPLARAALAYAVEHGIPCLSLVSPASFHLVDEGTEDTFAGVSAVPAAPAQATDGVGAVPPGSTECLQVSWEEQAGIATEAPCDLTLTGALANIWVWPHLDPPWFMNRRMRLSAGTPRENQP